MRIGPLFDRPPVLPLLTSLSEAFGNAGITLGGNMLKPEKIGRNGVIGYDTLKQTFSPFIQVKVAGSYAQELYRKMGGDTVSNAPFAVQAGEAESVFEMSTKVVGSALREKAGELRYRPRDWDEMLNRVDSLGRMTMREIVRAQNMAEKEDSIGLDARILDAAAEDASLAATLVFEDDVPSAKRAADLMMISGVIRMAGRVGSADEAVDTMLSASSFYLQAKRPIAAAMAAEVAIPVRHSNPDQLRPGNDAALRAASSWLAAALSLRDDVVAASIAVYRGIQSSFIAGPDAVELRRRLLQTSASILVGKGMHADAAREYLRIAHDQAALSKWLPRDWERIADSLRKAQGEYKKHGGFLELIDWLEEIEDEARSISRSMFEDLKPGEKRIAADSCDADGYAMRGVVRARYGALELALGDLKWADMLERDNAWVLGEIGHVYHMIGEIHGRSGDREKAMEMLKSAMANLDRAIDVAKRSRVRIPMLYARRGAAYLSAGNLDAAIRDLKVAKRQAPKDEHIGRYLEAANLIRQDRLAGKKENGQQKEWKDAGKGKKTNLISFDQARSRRSKPQDDPGRS